MKKKLICTESKNCKDAIVGEVYEVYNGILYTKISPIKRHQKKIYHNMEELNKEERERGVQFDELLENIVCINFRCNDGNDISLLKIFTKKEISQMELYSMIIIADSYLYENGIYDNCGANYTTLMEYLKNNNSNFIISYEKIMEMNNIQEPLKIIKQMKYNHYFEL